MQINAIIVDDEPLAQNVILQYAKEIHNLNIVCVCNDALEALEAISENPVNLMFLDINMPKLSGIDFLRNIKNPPLVIFTTAYTDYALESYELNALDYLKKPFSFERFLKAVQKAGEQIKLIYPSLPAEEMKSKYLFIKSNKKVHKVSIDEIFYIEGLGDYIKIHLKDSHLVTNSSMKKMEDMLPEKDFFRIHKSFIIRFDKITTIEGNMVEINKKKLPIGNNYRQDFFDLVNRNTIS
ncbi:MAG: DNA-binding response regulator [Bacteroidetes bacterium GWF2_42_66]|nr:MAG: DNA-binding response regulator [Bacteroidetes bacterium GWA2_42_15]OFX99911.1 MAG: DNA-binding response regulator [Bacteroidetes bacterium GWE2_42_39]OFY40096.1 MAG: DNA-binding response regulator [Bacteroidetes bacterium GWF2_42_66]HAZ00607.1 DNA-binding response regulator [Marinilabiliales bacterium]HBL73918.1 DNA-binding response regulator [Prolixibacteraceae bacterium]